MIEFLMHKKINASCELAASNIFYQITSLFLYFDLITVTAEKPAFYLKQFCKWFKNTESFAADKKIFKLILNLNKMNEAELYMLFKMRSDEKSVNIYLLEM